MRENPIALRNDNKAGDFEASTQFGILDDLSPLLLSGDKIGLKTGARRIQQFGIASCVDSEFREAWDRRRLEHARRHASRCWISGVEDG